MFDIVPRKNLVYRAVTRATDKTERGVRHPSLRSSRTRDELELGAEDVQHKRERKYILKICSQTYTMV